MRIQCEFCQHIQEVSASKAGKFIQCENCLMQCRLPLERIAKSMTFDDFVIDERIGSGGMGTVYRAHQISLERQVAVKFLNSDFSKDPDFIAKFLKEARLAASLNHPNIVQAYAAGECDGTYYFAMEYVEGQTVAEILSSEYRLSEERSLEIAIKTTEALGEAWKRKHLIHRDIKPDNIMISNEGTVKLMDLGLSCGHFESEASETDQIVGSPQFICPEQIMGELMDIRGDLYSLGASLYQMLSGVLPFAGQDASETMKMHLSIYPTSLDQVGLGISTKTSQIVDRLMRKKASERYANAAELLVDLEKALNFLRKGQNGTKVMRRSSSAVSQQRKTKVVQPKKANKSMAIAIAAVVGLVLLSMVIAISFEGHKSHSEEAQSRAQEVGFEEDLIFGNGSDSDEASLELYSNSLSDEKSDSTATKKKEEPITRAVKDWLVYYKKDHPGMGWRGQFFSADRWNAVKLPAGYGYDVRSVLDFGKDVRDKPITAYFRREVYLNEIKSVKAEVTFDDGVIVYVNNKVVYVRNLPTEPDFTEKATDTIKGGSEGLYHSFEIDSSFFIEGKNVITAEVHQAKSSSSDLILDLKLQVSGKSLFSKKRF